MHLGIQTYLDLKVALSVLAVEQVQQSAFAIDETA